MIRTECRSGTALRGLKREDRRSLLSQVFEEVEGNGRIPERSNEGRRIHVGTKTVSAGSIDVAEDASHFGDNSGAVSCADNHHVERRPGARVKGLITPAAAHRGSSCGPVSSYTQGALV